jgi:phenylpropionate dioxygenase-like ring-hydroxylating dioxygenase large terminal subunit
MTMAGVREDWVPKAAYIDPGYVRIEKERLWPRVWQVACREEEIPEPGDYVTFDVADESIIVVRLADRSVAAYYNACQHRGRRLTEGCGSARHFFCQFHGWRYNLDGSLRSAVDRQDWGDRVSDSELRLKSPLVDTWGGFVFVNMDLDAVPLRDYLSPIPEIFDPYEFHLFRHRWYKTVVLPCNWKTALEAFNEGYHVQATHPQLLRNNDDMTVSASHGKHAMFTGAEDNWPLGAPSRRLELPLPEDLRPGIIAYYELLEQQLRAIVTPRGVQAVKRLNELEDGKDPRTVLTAMKRFISEALSRRAPGIRTSRWTT